MGRIETALEGILNEIDLQGTISDEFSVIRFVQSLDNDEYNDFREILGLPLGNEVMFALMEYVDAPISKILALLQNATRYRAGAIQIDLSKGEKELKVIPFSRN